MESIKNVSLLEICHINGVDLTLSKEWLKFNDESKAVFVVRCSDWDHSARCVLESEARELFGCEVNRLLGK